MSRNRFLIVGVLLMLSAAILIACGSTATPTETPPTGEPAASAAPEVPFEAAWAESAHADVASEAFVHWNEEDPAEVPTSCAKCHSAAGYLDFLGADGSEAGVVDAAVSAVGNPGIQCVACHNNVTVSKTTVTFPSGLTVAAGDDSRCMECHQGRESKVSIDAAIARFGEEVNPDAVPDAIKDGDREIRLGFLNVHYYAAAATLYGTEAKGGYEYDGMLYDAKNTHVEGYDTCTSCHNPHSLEVRVEQCATCHQEVKTVEDLKKVRELSSAKDYDGDGNVDEGMYYEIQGLQEALYAQIQTYAKEKADTAIVYSKDVHPYFFIDANNNGSADEDEAVRANAYSAWTPRLLKAAYNYQVSLKDPGAFAHGNKYIIQLLHDSIADLGGDVSDMVREDAGHFAGNAEAFRHWDAEGEVPYSCVKCHTSGGLPEFVQGGGTVVVDGRGRTLIAGLGPMEPSNGFMCSTCHDEANWPNRYAIASVVFPSGRTVSFGDKDADGKWIAADSNLCISCHQGRESTTSVDNALQGKEEDTPDPTLSFKNVHYLSAGATWFGTEVKGAYEYAGKVYLGKNTHPTPGDTCQGCHDVHALTVNETLCTACHAGAKPEAIRAPGDTVDYDGDGDVTEGVAGEIETLRDTLLTEIKTASTEAGATIIYTQNYPYWVIDADGDGKGDRDADGKAVAVIWTPRLLRAAYNLQYALKDPGAFTHNPKYLIQILIDSIEDLGGDVSQFTRPEAPAPQ